jgi:uncharacterized membrane protein (GlpM family)
MLIFRQIKAKNLRRWKEGNDYLYPAKLILHLKINRGGGIFPHDSKWIKLSVFILVSSVNAYILDLTLSFIVGGAWVLLSSTAAQRFGGKVGGFIAGLPATGVLAMFFITYSEGARHGFEVAGVFPLAVSGNAAFLAAFAAFSRKSVLAGLMAALGIWIIIQSVLLYIHPIHFSVIVTVGVLVFLVSLKFINQLDIPDPGTRPSHQNIREILIRAGSGGVIVVMAMLGSRFGGPVFGGMLSAFPATTLSTLIIANTYGGKDLARSMARPMMISGVVNCMVFALAYRHMVLHVHILIALAIAYACTMISAAVTFYWINIHHCEHARFIHS